MAVAMKNIAALRSMPYLRGRKPNGLNFIGLSRKITPGVQIVLRRREAVHDRSRWSFDRGYYS